MLVVAIVLASCHDAFVALPPPGFEQPERTTLVVEPLPAEPPAWTRLVQVEHWLPGPADRQYVPTPSRAELEQECRGCHIDHAREWAGSQHASAWSSREFQRAFAREPLPFCQGCHAPESSPLQPVPEDAAAIGIGCVTCHVEPGSDLVWAAGNSRSAGSESAPHRLARSPAFGGPRACAGCHEFEFPDSAFRTHPLAMQSTITEHRQSEHRNESCSRCHMPPIPDIGKSRRNHAFPGAYDRAMLARALHIESERIAAGKLRLTLRPGEVGHAVPSGDLLRRLEVALVEIDRQGQERVLDRRWLRREFANRTQRSGIMLRDHIGDTRVGIGERSEREVILRVPPGADERSLRWRILHQRVAHGGDPRNARIEGQL